MKIGIVTYHDINNYGAQLQASSLQRYIEAQGHEVEVVDYKPIRTRVRIIMTILRPLLKGDIKQAKLELNKRKMFASSIKSMARIGKKSLYTESQLKKSLYNSYDLLICGSDELWNFQNYMGYRPAYILDFPTNNTRKMSYAASMGSGNPSEELKQTMTNSLANFSSILVRDPYTFDFVKNQGFDVSRVVDPTFLFDFKPVLPSLDNYMMISGALSKAQVELAIETAKKLKLVPVSVGCQYPGYEDIEVSATPIEWIGYIKNAKFHFTSLFHGAVFSLKNDTPFAIYCSQAKKQKVSSLVSWFNQETRMVDESATVETLIECSKLPFTDSYHETFSQLVNNSKELLLTSIEKK
ncbi:polysaccharide pyruvyl transferase family protein [Pseudocolwellia sp. HL-MZ7]|uniref:polysaccharide pyruvyl transferase family protein n=1 Tax=Pseudocolwellia sp. HL-MZ7 TaxID=3400627 RepID=UPI003CF8B25F